MSNQLKQISALLQSQKYQQAAEEAQAILKKENRNLGAMILLAQALIQLDELVEAQNVLNDFYSKVKRDSPEDALFFNALTTQETLAIQLQSTSNSTQNKKKGREIQMTNKFQIIDFLDKKQKFDKMLQETEIYCVLLLEDSRYRDIEETYFWLMEHKGLTNDVRASFGLRIFEIDEFYKPQLVKPDQLFAKLHQLTPGSPALSAFALKIIETLDNSNLKKTLYSALSSSDPQKHQQDFKDFCGQVIQTGEAAFSSTDNICKSPASMRMFIRYVGAALIQLQFLSPEWDKHVDLLSKVCDSESFKKAQHKALKLQLQLLTVSLMEMTRLVKQAVIPKDFSELAISKADNIGDLQKLIAEATLQSIEKVACEILEITPFVNAYLAVCALTENPLVEVEPEKIQAKIKQAQFLWSKMQVFRENAPAQASDFNVYLACLQLLLNLDKAQVDTNFQIAEEIFNKNQNQISTATKNLYLSLTVGLKWQNHLRDGDWINAIGALEQLAALKPEKATFVAIKTCEIQLQNLNSLCETQDQREAQVKAIFNTLQSHSEPESLQIQGYLLYCFGDILESDQKAALNKWLLALKKDQTNPDTFYSLAVYYFTIGDLKRASGCLDKALKLKGSFELALVLAYYIASDQDQRLQLVDRFMESNRSSAISYFFRGLLMQQKQDFIQAIEMFQNAMKFYTISRQRVQPKNLLPQVKLAITENPLGIFGNHGASICWVYLSDCFSKIDKPNVALKCFNQAVSEISRLVPQEVIEPNEEVKSLLSILNYDKFCPSNLEKTNDQSLKLLFELKPQKWALECLLLGAKFVPTPQQSISVLHVALRCLPADKMPNGALAFILTELIDKITGLIKLGVVIEDGQAKLYSESREMISRLQQLVDFCVKRTDLDSNQNLQKKILNALFVIAQRTHNEQSSLLALARADYLANHFDQAVFKKNFLLDTCKIIHEHRRFSNSQDLQQKKITLIRQAICQDPLQANLWVHLYLFSLDETVQAKAIFKAYDLEPESTFVQEHILRFYLKTKQWKKAFKILVRSYQQATNKNQLQQPIVLATLAYLNAVCFLEYGDKEQLSEAISLIKMIQREDMSTLLSELLIYLRHFNGDYIATISYLQKNLSVENNLLLLKAYYGASVTTISQAEVKLDLVDRSHQLLSKVLEAENQQNDVLSKKCQDLIDQFFTQPQESASTLALYQEICLQKGLVQQKILLDSDEAKKCLQKLPHRLQRTLLIQSLRMVQQRDGKITESMKIVGQDGTQYEAKNQKTYTNFIVDMSRFKPSNLSAMQYRALFRHFINSQMDNSLLQGIFDGDKSQVKDQNLVQGLSTVLSQRRDEEDNSQRLLMQNPLSLEANTKWVWSLLRAGKLVQAIKAHKLVTQKIQMGVISGQVDNNFTRLDNFMKTILSSQILDSKLGDRLSLIAQISVQLCGSVNAAAEDVRIFAAKIIQVVQKLQPSDQKKIIYLICKTLELILQEQSHFAVYNKLLKELLNFSAVAKISAESINVLWNFQLLSSASTLIETKKFSQIAAICKEAEKLCTGGHQKRSTFPITLIQARMHLGLKNHKQLIEKLKVDEAVMERDFLIALSQYTQQAYKEFYLLCIGLVAGAKALQSDWQLAYAYYLKAFAEMTFLNARKLGVTLKEDFDSSEGDFGEKFFHLKAKTSIGKCKRVLVASGQVDSLIGEAISTMEGQLKQES